MRSVVRRDHGEELGPMHGMYGTLDAELEVQRTTKRAELTAFLCLLGRVYWPRHVSRGQQRYHWWTVRRTKCMGPKFEGRRRVDFDMGGGAQSSPRRFSFLEVDHVKRRRTNTEKSRKRRSSRDLSLNERTDELPKIRVIPGWRGWIRGRRKGRRFTERCSVRPVFTVWRMARL